MGEFYEKILKPIDILYKYHQFYVSYVSKFIDNINMQRGTIHSPSVDHF